MTFRFKCLTIRVKSLSGFFPGILNTNISTISKSNHLAVSIFTPVTAIFGCTAVSLYRSISQRIQAFIREKKSIAGGDLTCIFAINSFKSSTEVGLGPVTN